MVLIIYTDGASSGNPGPMGIGIVIWKEGKKIGEISEYIGNGTNNIAEYTAVKKALELAIEMGEKDVVIKSDSELVIKQLNNEYKVKDRDLKRLKMEIDAARLNLNVKFIHIPRERNKSADSLSKGATKDVSKGKA